MERGQHQPRTLSALNIPRRLNYDSHYSIASLHYSPLQSVPAAPSADSTSSPFPPCPRCPLLNPRRLLRPVRVWSGRVEECPPVIQVSTCGPTARTTHLDGLLGDQFDHIYIPLLANPIRPVRRLCKKESQHSPHVGGSTHGGHCAG